MNYIKDHENLNDKKILLRLDLNVPLKNGVITDQTRIDKILPVIKFLLKKNSKIIIISHVGRPKGKVNKELSMKPICENLEKKINRKIKVKIFRDRLTKKNIKKIIDNYDIVCDCSDNFTTRYLLNDYILNVLWYSFT